MKFTSAKAEFDIRYYKWAVSEFEREVEESFPILRHFKTGSAWKTYSFMRELSKSDRSVLAHALLKRFHPNAVQALGEKWSTAEESLCSRRDGLQSNVLAFDAEIRARRSTGELIKVASKRRLRKEMFARFRDSVGHECVVLPGDDEPDLRLRMKSLGWIVNTFVDFGRRETVLRYTHNIVSEKTFAYEGGQLPLIMGSVMSFNSYLGIASQTEWYHILENEIELVCNLALGLCNRFFDTVPTLLAGLDSDTLTPDKMDIPGF